MRPLEGWLLLANMFAFLGISISWKPSWQWARHLPALALVLALAQVVIEGPRWQMFLAYVMTVAFCLVWWRWTVATRRIPATSKPRVYRWRSARRAGIVVALVSAAALPVLVPVFRFARPAGPHETSQPSGT